MSSVAGVLALLIAAAVGVRRSGDRPSAAGLGVLAAVATAGVAAAAIAATRAEDLRSAVFAALTAGMLSAVLAAAVGGAAVRALEHRSDRPGSAS